MIAKLGPRRVKNTDKSSRTAINAFSSVILKEFFSGSASMKSQSVKWIIGKLREKVFTDYEGGPELPRKSLHNLNVTLGEFVKHYRKKDNTRLTPSTLLTYLEGINRWLKDNMDIIVNFLYDKTFKESKTGFMNVANRIAAAQQAQGVRIRPHNTLTDSDVEKILTHSCTTMLHPVSYLPASSRYYRTFPWHQDQSLTLFGMDYVPPRKRL